jgi:hypothetical protein
MLLGCSTVLDQPPPADAGDDRVGMTTPDSASPAPDAGPRLLPHDGTIVPTLALGIVYVGDVDAGGPPNNGTDLQWLLGSPYWLWLDEYGIQSGTIAGTVRIATSALIQPSDVDTSTGLIGIGVLQIRIEQALQGNPDAGTTPAITIPGANGWIFYLPDGINVALGQRGTYTYQTCIDTSGYHAWDGFEPYAVMPPCDEGRSLYAASHELAELVTDPQPYHGWVSDIDIAKTGGEVADLCAQPVTQEDEVVTQLWSNESNRCVP